MSDPLAPLKESIKHVPAMKYVLAAVGLASAAATAFAYFNSIRYGVIAMSAVLVFAVLIILVTNIPKLKHIRFFVSAFLTFILLAICFLSGWFIWTIVKNPEMVLGDKTKDKQVVMDVVNSAGESIKEGVGRLKVTGQPEIMSDILGGTVTFPASSKWNVTDSATILLNEASYEKYLRKVSVNDLMNQTFTVTLQRKHTKSKKVVFNLDAGFCDDVKTKFSRLHINTTKQNNAYSVKSTFSGSVESITDNLYKYAGGHLIIEVNGKQIPFEDKVIPPIDVQFGNPKMHVNKQIREVIKELTCSFSQADIHKITSQL